MRHQRGFTLVEVLLALSVLAVIGLALAGLMAFTTQAYAASDQLHQNLLGARNVMQRLQSTARKARLITAVTPNSVVFWAGDANGDGQINKNELFMVYLDGNHALRQVNVAAPDSLNSITPLASVTSGPTAMAVLTTDPYKDDEPLAEDVTQFSVSTGLEQPPLATSLRVTLTVGSDQPVTLQSTMNLRVDDTANVARVANVWTLTP